jgi:hypothetical protein
MKSRPLGRDSPGGLVSEKKLRSAALTVALLILFVGRVLTTLLLLVLARLALFPLPGLAAPLALSELPGLTTLLPLSGLVALLVFLVHIVCHKSFS